MPPDEARVSPGAHPVEVANARCYALRDALLDVVEDRAEARDLRPGEVLMAVNGAVAALLLRVAHAEGERRAGPEQTYRRATEHLLAQLPRVDARAGREPRGAGRGRAR
jgi:hypothetical protein